MSSIGHNAYRANAVETASPEQLILMCYDGALRFMRRAVRAIEAKNYADASNSVGRAQAVINELNITLDMEVGGEISRNLRDLYLFVNRHLASSIINSDVQPINESIALISDIRDSWAEAMNVGSQAA